MLAAALAISAGAFTLSACSDDDNGPSGNGAVALTLNPSTLNITPGSTGSATYTITRTAPFTTAVTLTTAGEPTGMDITVTPSVVDPGETTGSIDVVVAADATPGTYPISVSAAGSGITTRTSTLNVVVGVVPAAR
jgi:uncharacterized membrane protein